MPSKSKAQHNLMAMVANNPAAAKRLGIPQSVGKEFMKADKRKMKKYGLGGPTSYSGEDSDEGMKMSTRRGSGDSGMSFKDAFAAARKAGKDKFEWFNPKKGKIESFTTELEKKTPKAEAPKEVKVTKTETSVKTADDSDNKPRSGGRGSKPASAKVGTGRYDDPTSSFSERVFSPLSKLTDIFGRRAEERVMRNMGVGREEARKRLDALEDLKEKEGMRRGGSVKNGRPEMRESKGMMKKEVAFMKKKGAPKSMIKHEEAEMEGKKMRKFAGGGGMPVPPAKPSMQERMAASKQRLDALKQKNAANRARVDAVAAKYPVNKAPGGGAPPAPVGGGQGLPPMPPAGAPPGGGGMGGPPMQPMRKGGMARGSFRRAADGVASKGKTKAHVVKMREGGSVNSAVSRRADGIAQRGKTRGKMC